MKRTNLLIRSALVSDADDFCKLLIKLDCETIYTPFQAGERSSDVNRYIKYLEEATKDSVLIFAIDPQKDVEKIVGFISAKRGATTKKRHVAAIGIGVLQSYLLSGVGRSLVNACLESSLKLGIKRLEAYIPRSNLRSINLLRKYNFELEGIKRKAVFINGEYEDEYAYSMISA